MRLITEKRVKDDISKCKLLDMGTYQGNCQELKGNSKPASWTSLHEKFSLLMCTANNFSYTSALACVNAPGLTLALQLGLHVPSTSVQKLDEKFKISTLYELFKIELHCDYRNRGHPDNENQSQGRTETKDSNIFKLSQSNAEYRTMNSQLVDR